MNRVLALACLFAGLVVAGLVVAAPAGGAPVATVASAVDWVQGTMVLTGTLALDPSVPSTVRAEADARADLESQLPAMLIRALTPVVMDSMHTAGQLLESDAGFFEGVAALARTAVPEEVHLSADFASMVERWRFPLFGSRGIASPLLPAQAQPVRRALGYVATRPFTGLVIVARGRLAAVGTGGTAALQPALFPRIWDEDMNLVLEAANCTPEALRARGMVAYLSNIDDPAIVTRAGTSPLRVIARAVFGTNPVDVVISREAARQLLTLPDNIRVLTEGRIAIVY